ncbi:MAG: CPBP family intramembrane glutamic endopeptidase [Candidatus Hodarchaeota archaeon]
MIFSEEKKRIAKKRAIFFFYDIILIFVFVFVMLLIPLFIIPMITEERSVLYGILFYIMRAVFIFIGIPLMIYVTNLIYEPQKKKVIIEEDITPAMGHLKLFRITKKNYKYQIFYGFLLFFIVFLPIDFFTYLFIPEVLEYQAWVIGARETNYYLSPFIDDYFIFLISAIIIQISVSVTEETIARGLLTKRGSEYFMKMSAVIISSLYWGLGHLAYILDIRSWYPVLWFFQSFIIGIILSLMVLRKMWILPAIIAHALNNIVAAHTMWNFWQGNSFQAVTFFMYIPLFIIGILFVTVCLLLVWPFSSVKRSISNGFALFKTYFKKDSEEKKIGDTLFRIFFDILIGGLIFLMGFLIAI